jgi:hypothetical protein
VLHGLLENYRNVLRPSSFDNRASDVVRSSGESGGVALSRASAKSERRSMMGRSCTSMLKVRRRTETGVLFCGTKFESSQPSSLSST